MLVLVVTKNVREELRICAISELREGIDILQGLKPSSNYELSGTAKAVP